MELSDFAGLHELSGVDMDSESVIGQSGNFEDCQVINFIIDGETYTAVEDPEDGYRSSMNDIFLSTHIIKNTFTPIKVNGVMRGENQYGYIDDVIDFYDIITNKVILSIGTADSDDYYPCFEARFIPENMAINQHCSAKEMIK